MLCCTFVFGRGPSTGQQHSARDPSSLALPALAMLSRAAGHWSPVSSDTALQKGRAGLSRFPPAFQGDQ